MDDFRYKLVLYDDNNEFYKHIKSNDFIFEIGFCRISMYWYRGEEDVYYSGILSDFGVKQYVEKIIDHMELILGYRPEYKLLKELC